MKRTYAILGLILCLTLSGCGGSAQENTGSVLGQAAGLDETDPLLIIDGRKISAWQYLYWLAMDCRELEERCEISGVSPDWSAPFPDGSTLEDLVKADALSDTALYAAVDAWAKAYGCTLTEREYAALPERSYPYLTAEQGRVLTVIGREYAKLYALYEAPDSVLAPATGELELFEQESGYLTAEQIPVPTGGSRDAARQRAEELFARLNAAEDPETSFTTLLAETGGGALTDADWTDSLRDAAAALEPGQISGVIETDAGFSILRRLPSDEAAVRAAYFDALLQDAAETSSIQLTETYTALDASAFWSAVKRTESVIRR